MRNLYSEKEVLACKQGVLGGYLFANCKQMRKDNIEQKLLDFVKKKADSLIYPEEDTLNIICYPHIKTLPLRHMTGPWYWDIFGENFEKMKSRVYSSEEIAYAAKHPIEIHFCGVKPHCNPKIYKSEIWFYYLAFTPP